MALREDTRRRCRYRVGERLRGRQRHQEREGSGCRGRCRRVRMRWGVEALGCIPGTRGRLGRVTPLDAGVKE